MFLGPFAGIMISDYYLVHKCRVDVPAMYNPNGRYRYTSGVVSLFCTPIISSWISPALTAASDPLFPIQNWRAALALIVAVPPLLPGLINSINPKVYIGGASHLFRVAWLFGFFVASGVYTIVSLVFPAKETFLTDEEDEGSREERVGEVGVGDEKKLC